MKFTKQFWITALFAGVLVLVAACGGGNSSLDAGTVARDNEGGKTEQRFMFANGCYAVQELASGRFLVAPPQGSPEFSADAQAHATPFFMKPTGLGRYLFFDPDQRWLAVSSGNESVVSAVDGVVHEAGATVHGVGDLLALAGPATLPANQALGQVGDEIAQLQVADAVLNANRRFAMSTFPHDGVEWELIERPTDDGFALISTANNEPLAVVTETGVGAAFDFVAHVGCAAYPEAELNAVGTPFRGTNSKGEVVGYAETHLHLGGAAFLGGRLHHGEPFHRFGIVEALKNCDEDHGPGGVLDLMNAAVDPTVTTPNHDTAGWPTFRDWPSWHGQMHQQTYYMWIKRAWMGGLRFMVNHLVNNEVICMLSPLKQSDCNEMIAARLQLQMMHEMQDYIDAQEGGPGQGFFRMVYSPQEARRVIESGKLAVIIGLEVEKPLDCGEYLGQPECTPEQIDARMREWYELGVRSMFPIHLFDNANGGAEISRYAHSPVTQNIFNLGNLVETGHYFATIPCEQAEQVEPGEAQSADYGLLETVGLQLLNGAPAFLGEDVGGCEVNARGLTSTGEYFVNRMIDMGIILELDHTGPLARKRILDIAEERGVPTVTGHTDGFHDGNSSQRIINQGGIVSRFADVDSTRYIGFSQDLAAGYARRDGNSALAVTGLGTDINGLHLQAPPREDAAENPLPYPFTSFMGDVVFDRQVTGQRVFDFNVDGAAHYGLYPDYLADIQMQPGGTEALEVLFRSAEAYLQLWEKVDAKRH